ncbi:MAG: DUF4331 domain-containing protein [Chitinophagaceae bacterium]
MRRKFKRFSSARLCLIMLLAFAGVKVQASSHREAPLISRDPLADNTDVYAFRSPDDVANATVTIIANFIPFESPEGGPNYYNFSPGVRYEIHIKNRADTPGDDITYRFTFAQTNQDPTTFFNIRLGQQNLKTTYICEKKVGAGGFITVVSNGVVPPNNIGPRSIDNATVGLGMNYNTIMTNAIATTGAGEKVFCGPVDDPFFVDLGGVFDVGNFRPEGNTVNPTKDAVARFNCHTIAIKVPVDLLQKDGRAVTTATSILDGDFVIGVWASASRQQLKTINTAGAETFTGAFVQVSRLGMPLTNEAVIPIGMKDKWNSMTPYANNDLQFADYFKNPELSLYMAEPLPNYFGAAVPSLNSLRVQTKSLGAFDFRNNMPGLWPLKGNPALVGTAFDPATYGNILLPDNHSPRSVDILPIFYTGVPNLAPYQLATGKTGGPLSAGKPFINNFLPTLGDMLRLNMAVPPTPRNSPDFSSLGIVNAAVLGLTDSRFNGNTSIQMIPNMDGFPNGRRLEDDVTTIELQAVSGVALAAIGLWYDDYYPGVSASPVTTNLVKVLSFTSGPTKNDTTLKAAFPYVQTPWRGFDYTMKPRF